MAEETEKPKLTAKDFQTFDRAYKQLWKRKAAKRDNAVGILSRDLLNKRQELTDNGRQKLVLKYGNKGLTVEYSLSELNKMALSIDKQGGKFKPETRGIPVAQVIQNSRVKVPFDGTSKPPAKTDYAKHKDVGNVILYKVAGDTLFFKVDSSKNIDRKDKKTYYQTRIKLNDWDTLIRNNKDYGKAAHMATMGNISFDCSCGRHQYWFRYLATIGGFALDPYEEAFPKIRNPRLVGVCCKHMVKAIGVMQSPYIRKRIEAEMAKQAKKEGWFTELEKKPVKTLTTKDLEEVIQANENLDVNKAYQQILRDKQAFHKALETPANKEKIEKLKTTAKKIYKDVDNKKEAENAKLRQKILLKDFEVYLTKAVYKQKQDIDKAITTYAKKAKMTVDDLRKLGEKVIKNI